MKAFRLCLLALLCLASTAHAQKFASSLLEREHAVTHHIDLKTVAEESDCSATAVGPNALLTAGHCELSTDYLAVDRTVVQITGRIHDESDHTIFLLNGITFDKYVPIVPDYTFAVGEDVTLFGNPGTHEDIFRRGYVQKVNSESQIVYFGLPISNGDSGAGIFNTDGKLVAVASFVQPVSKDEGSIPMGLSGAYPLDFTKDDLALAAKPVPQTFHFDDDVAPEKPKQR